MEEDSSGAKEERSERSESSEYYRQRLHSPCYILQQLIRAILKCLGVESNSPQQKLPARSSSSQESTDDPADHHHATSSSTSSEPQMKTLEDGVSLSTAFRRVPPRPPISSGGGSQHN